MGNLPGCSKYLYCHGGNGKYKKCFSTYIRLAAFQAWKTIACLVSCICNCNFTPSSKAGEPSCCPCIACSSTLWNLVRFKGTPLAENSPVARYGSKIHPPNKTCEIHHVQRRFLGNTFIFAPGNLTVLKFMSNSVPTQTELSELSSGPVSQVRPSLWFPKIGRSCFWMVILDVSSLGSLLPCWYLEYDG